MMGTSNPSTQLMELSQAQFVRTVHQYGIGCGHINTTFNNGSAYQQIEFTVVELQHDAFQFTLAHLSMGNFNPCLGDELA